MAYANEIRINNEKLLSETSAQAADMLLAGVKAYPADKISNQSNSIQRPKCPQSS